MKTSELKRYWYNLFLIDSKEWVFSTQSKSYANELLKLWDDCYLESELIK